MIVQKWNVTVTGCKFDFCIGHVKGLKSIFEVQKLTSQMVFCFCQFTDEQWNIDLLTSEKLCLCQIHRGLQKSFYGIDDIG